METKLEQSRDREYRIKPHDSQKPTSKTHIQNKQSSSLIIAPQRAKNAAGKMLRAPILGIENGYFLIDTRIGCYGDARQIAIERTSILHSRKKYIDNYLFVVDSDIFLGFGVRCRCHNTAAVIFLPTSNPRRRSRWVADPMFRLEGGGVV